MVYKYKRNQQKYVYRRKISIVCYSYRFCEEVLTLRNNRKIEV